jgi:hypothetical protein
MSVATATMQPDVAPLGALAAPQPEARKSRRDPKTGKVYKLDKNQWVVDDALTDDAAGRSDSGGSFGAAFTDNANAKLAGNETERSKHPGDKYYNMHSAKILDPNEYPVVGSKEIDDGVTHVYGIKKGTDGPLEVVAYHFDAKKFTPKQAKDYCHATIDRHAEDWIKNGEKFCAHGCFGPESYRNATPQLDEAARSAPADGTGAVVRKATVNASTWNDVDRSIDAVICTDSPAYSTEVKTGRAVKEVWLMSGLEFDPHVRCLNDHKRDDCDDVIGSVDNHRVAAHECVSRMLLSSAEPKICTKIREGHLRDVSVGGERREIVTIPAGQSKSIDGQVFTSERSEPLNIVTRLRIYEVSFTPIGSDPSAVTRSLTSITRSFPMLSKHQRKFMVRTTGLDPKATDEEAQKHHDALHPDVQKACRNFADAEEADEDAAKKKSESNEADRKKKVEEEEANRSRSANAVDADAIRKQGMDAERKRQAEITRLGEDLPSEVVRKALDDGYTVERAAVDFLKVQRTRVPGIGPGSPAVQVRSYDKDLTADVLGAALVVRTMNRLPRQEGNGSVFASDPSELLGRYRPGTMVRGGIGDWVPDFPTERLSDAQRSRNQDLLNRADRFRGLSLIDICRHCCRIDGVQLDTFAAPMEVAHAALDSVMRAGPSGGTFGAVFTQNFNAQMLGSYLEAGDSTLGWCSEGDAPDFKQGELAMTGKMGGLTLNGKQQADHLTWGDWNEPIQVSRFSGMYEVDETDLINDRFGVLRNGSPQEIGLSARRLRPNLIYSLLLSNYSAGNYRGPKLNQLGNQSAANQYMFCANNGNFLVASSNDLYMPAAGTAGVAGYLPASVGVGGLQAAIPAIGNQRLNGVPLNLTPRFALLPKDLDTNIRAALFSQQRIGANTGGGTMNPLQVFNIEPRTDSRLGTVGSVDPLNANKAVAGLAYHWFLACRPGEEGAKTIHVNYLLGSGRAPQIRAYVLGGPGAAGRWGIGWDVKMDIGAAPEDYRGMYYAESST